MHANQIDMPFSKCNVIQNFRMAIFNWKTKVRSILGNFDIISFCSRKLCGYRQQSLYCKFFLVKTGFPTELVVFNYHKHINSQKPFFKNIRCLFLDACISFLLFRRKKKMLNRISHLNRRRRNNVSVVIGMLDIKVYNGQGQKLYLFPACE
jgi:hypothetical protein